MVQKYSKRKSRKLFSKKSRRGKYKARKYKGGQPIIAKLGSKECWEKVKGPPLGSGAFGTVYKCRLTSIGQEAIKDLSKDLTNSLDVNTEYAMKVLIKPTLKHTYPNALIPLHDLTWRNSIENEYACHNMVDTSPNIPTLYAKWYEGDKAKIVMELIEGWEIYDALDEGREMDPMPDVAISIFKGICKAVKMCHDNNIVHNDISIHNIMIRQGELPESFDAMLIDFGWSRRMALQAPQGFLSDILPYSRDRGYGKVNYGSLMGMPPYESSKSDNKNDIWALGVVLYHLVLGLDGFRRVWDIGSRNLEDEMRANPNFKDPLIKKYLSLFELLLQPTAAERPTIDEVLDHELLK